MNKLKDRSEKILVKMLRLSEKMQSVSHSGERHTFLTHISAGREGL